MGRPGRAGSGAGSCRVHGGGTPTALEADDLRRILREVKAVLPLANDCEITVEGRLSNFGPDKMEACFDGGANRFSLGVQSFNTAIRQSMGRVSTREELIAQLERLMSYNQAAVIVDLIYGFPRQTMELWLEDIAVAQSLYLDGADCYQLNVYRQTPLGKAIEAGKMPAGADIPMQSAMFAAGVAAMQNAFYRRLSVSHWARTSRERNLYNLYVKGRAHCLAFLDRERVEPSGDISTSTGLITGRGRNRFTPDTSPWPCWPDPRRTPGFSGPLPRAWSRAGLICPVWKRNTACRWPASGNPCSTSGAGRDWWKEEARSWRSRWPGSSGR